MEKILDFFTGIMRRVSGFILICMLLYVSANVKASELHVGASSIDISPELPVSLQGQFHLRIAHTAETPLTANVVVLETRDGDSQLDVAVMVSCDLAYSTNKMLQMIREEVKKNIPELDVEKIFINGTHTHTAPVFENHPSFVYPVPKEGVLQVDDYMDFVVRRITEAIARAWESRTPGSVSWGLSHAAVAYNRRVVYSEEVRTPGSFADGKAQMYGNTNSPEFRNLESMDDHDVNTLFFWNNKDELIALCINIPCPAQEVEGRNAVNADFWHPAREKLKQRFGPEITVLGWVGASGDQSPRPMYRRAAEERMMKLRNLNRMEEIGRRISLAVEDAYETIKEDRYNNVPLMHRVEIIPLPMRQVTDSELRFSKAERDMYAAQIAADPKAAERVLTRMTWNDDVVKRYEMQKKVSSPVYETRVHVVRIGDIVICTNEFELFTDYGIRMQARSKALQTFTLQLVGGPGGYLPTENAVKGGGYSAVIQSGIVGPEGGQILVDRTVEMINELFTDKN